MIDDTTFNGLWHGFFIDYLESLASIIAALLVDRAVMFAQYTKQARPCGGLWR